MKSTKKYYNATKDHISLETAKMLEDCKVESRYKFFCGEWTKKIDEFGNNPISGLGIVKTYSDQHKFGYIDWCLPAFTWQEILWEREENFFEAGEIVKHTQKILLMIQAKLYSEADEYFRANCILIKK